MATFPSLSTGAVTQYPLINETVQPTQVIRFLDGSDQRFGVLGGRLRQWQVRLDLLTEGEIQQIELFFAEQLGDYMSFDFPDPITGSLVPNCRFTAPELITEYLGVHSDSTSFWISECRG
jgi:hypothetical protein